MQDCNKCLSVCRKAKKRDYTFLSEQIARCESCVNEEEISILKQYTYDMVRLNYVIAYWDHRRLS